MAFTLPESVHHYLTDPAVRAGVDSLADGGLKKVPAGLTWGETPKLYRALLAAQLVQIEFAIALEEVWREIWPTHVAGWEPLEPYEQAAEYDDVSVSVVHCWNEEWFGRCFSKSRASQVVGRQRQKHSTAVLCMGVMLSQEGLSAGFSIEGAAGFETASFSGFDFDEDLQAWWSPRIKIRSRAPEISTLQRASSDAVRILEST